MTILYLLFSTIMYDNEIVYELYVLVKSVFIMTLEDSENRKYQWSPRIIQGGERL